MTSISPVTAAPLAAANAPGGRLHRVPGFVQTAAKALGMDSTSVMSALRSGKSLADLAQQQGVSTDTLSAALQADAPSGVAGSADLAARTQNLINQKGIGGPGGHHHHHGSASFGASATGAVTGTLSNDQQSTLNALSGLLGTDSSSLLSQLQSGTSLGTLLDDKGVTTDQLASSLQKGLLIDTQA